MLSLAGSNVPTPIPPPGDRHFGPRSQADAAPKTLKMSIGAAFPPTHPTSRLCLELLQEALAAGHLNNILDVGCGAGVLSLAAAAWGVRRWWPWTWPRRPSGKLVKMPGITLY